MSGFRWTKPKLGVLFFATQLVGLSLWHIYLSGTKRYVFNGEGFLFDCFLPSLLFGVFMALTYPGLLKRFLSSSERSKMN
jgi:hypothetical protein